MLGANLYFAHRRNPALLAGFLAAKVDSRIAAVEKLELEWVADAPLDPGTLLGEVDGRRRPRLRGRKRRLESFNVASGRDRHGRE